MKKSIDIWPLQCIAAGRQSISNTMTSSLDCSINSSSINKETSNLKNHSKLLQLGLCNSKLEQPLLNDFLRRLHRSKLRRLLYCEYKSRGFIVTEQIRGAVDSIISSDKDNSLDSRLKSVPMHQVFLCKCGWLLFNPSTLPCGHTMCKHCADENLFCIYCGHTIDDVSSPNLFLVHLLSTWFPGEYQSSQHKLDAKILLTSEDYELALNEIDICISILDDDYSAFQLRAEIYLKLENYKGALVDATKSCELNSECGRSQFIRGSCFSHLGKLNEAIDAFQLCLELEPEDMALCSLVINKLDSILSLPDTGTKLSDSDSSSDEGVGGKRSKLDTSTNENTESSCRHASSSSSNTSSTTPSNTQTNKSYTDKIDVERRKNDCTEAHTPDTDYKNNSATKTENNVSNVEEKIHGVPKKLLYEEDFECKLCYELLFKPITTTCGHVFCKNCLLRSLDHNVTCPICRVSLAGFLSNPLKPVTKLIEDILSLFFTDEFGKRRQAFMSRMERLARVGKDEEVEIPIFVCSIAFPSVKCPLHIFEPKCRLMIRECIESGSRKFGMCVPQGDDGFSDMGTICEITKIQNLPDGRYVITATAGQRFIIQQKSVEDSIDYAKVKYFCDEPEDLNNDTFNAASRRAYDHLSQYITSLNESEQDCIINALGPLPQYESNFSHFQHGVPWIWWGLAALPLNFSAKLVLLKSKCASERMLSLQRFLRFLSRMQSTPNGGQQNNTPTSQHN